MRRKALEAKGQFCQGMLYPDTFLLESMIEICVHPWEDPENRIWTVNQANQNDCERKPEEMSHKRNSSHYKARLRDSPSESDGV